MNNDNDNNILKYKINNKVSNDESSSPRFSVNYPELNIELPFSFINCHSVLIDIFDVTSYISQR